MTTNMRVTEIFPSHLFENEKANKYMSQNLVLFLPSSADFM